MKENSEMRNMMMGVIKTGTHNTTNNTNNTNTNSHNKTFNLNFFLNETCKDAMNIMDFVESIKFDANSGNSLTNSFHNIEAAKAFMIAIFGSFELLMVQ
mgnify:CR=1 FL=1